MSFLKKLFDHEYKELTRFEKIADEVLALDEEYSKLSDEELKEKTNKFKEREVQTTRILKSFVLEFLKRKT